MDISHDTVVKPQGKGIEGVDDLDMVDKDFIKQLVGRYLTNTMIQWETIIEEFKQQWDILVKSKG